ncbi:MAG: putative lipoprotein YerB, partial [Candidatus Parcubacteria bacterium]
RLLAIYPDVEKIDRIGPVRSARPYFLDWAAEFDAVFVHVGGSPEALDKLAAYDMRDLNEMSAGRYFWRDASRNAPHNAYTSSDRLVEADQKRFADRPAPQVAGWRFKEDAPPAERPASASLAVEYGDPKADVTWTYDAAQDAYRRAQGGKIQTDEDGAVLLAKNIVVQYTDISVIDDVGRRRIATVGDGDALIALDGLTVHGTWRKDDRTSRTRYYDASGNQIRFNAGPTWIEVVPKDTNVSF